MHSPTLLAQSGPLKGRAFTLTGTQIIGRATNCELELHGYGRVSRHHARFNWDGQTLSVADTQSTNGLLVNGQKVSQATLRDGDQIQLGDFSATVRVPAPKTATAGGVKNRMNGWHSLSAPKKWGIAVAAAIVLVLGLMGLRGQGAPDVPVAATARAGEMPDVADAPPPASAAKTQLAPAAMQNIKPPRF